MKICALVLVSSLVVTQSSTTSGNCLEPLEPCAVELLSAGLRCAKRVDDLTDENKRLRLDLADTRRALDVVVVPPAIDEGGVPSWLFWAIAIVAGVSTGVALGSLVNR